MGATAMEWYCRPVDGGVWARVVENAFGAYTPCGMVTLVVCVSHLVLFGVCFYRIWRTARDSSVARFKLRSPYYNYLLGLLASYCVAEPLVRLALGWSVADLDGETSLGPFEIVSLVIEAVAWCCMLIMIGLETKIYIREIRWYIRFVVIYVLVGESAMFNLVLSVREYYDMSVFYIYTSQIVCQVLFGFLLLVYVPNLDPYPGYTSIRTEVLDNTEYEALPAGEQICPERKANIFSRIFFSWITPLMQQGYKRPITEKDVWKLDSWDETETLYSKFQKCWTEESQRPKPWLLRALHSSLGGRFWLGGLFKIGNDISQFVGPVILNLLLQSMQQGDPSWNGYIYAFSIFAGVSYALARHVLLLELEVWNPRTPVHLLVGSYSQALGVLFEAQYFQNVMRVGFRLRSTLEILLFIGFPELLFFVITLSSTGCIAAAHFREGQNDPIWMLCAAINARPFCLGRTATAWFSLMLSPVYIKSCGEQKKTKF